MSKYTDDLYDALGLVNTWDISRRYECPTISYSTRHPHASGHSDYRVKIEVLVNGKWRRKTLRPGSDGTAKENRDRHLQAAVDWATEHLGISDWSPTGCESGTWIPTEVKNRIKADLAQWRKARRAEQKDMSE